MAIKNFTLRHSSMYVTNSLKTATGFAVTKERNYCGINSPDETDLTFFFPAFLTT